MATTMTALRFNDGDETTPAPRKYRTLLGEWKTAEEMAADYDAACARIAAEDWRERDARLHREWVESRKPRPLNPIILERRIAWAATRVGPKCSICGGWVCEGTGFHD